jgi:uncharacterized UBP type Zn finger protein
MQTKVYTYQSDSSNDNTNSFAHLKPRKSKSIGSAVAPKDVGSGTCTFEVMDDTTADMLIRNDKKSTLATSKERAKKVLSLPSKVTYPMKNLGNTCFFNSVMQCLTHTLPFHTICLNRTH